MSKKKFLFYCTMNLGESGLTISVKYSQHELEYNLTILKFQDIGYKELARENLKSSVNVIHAEQINNSDIFFVYTEVWNYSFNEVTHHNMIEKNKDWIEIIIRWFMQITEHLIYIHAKKHRHQENINENHNDYKGRKNENQKFRLDVLHKK